jgi:arabinofuranosyltransferase
MAVHAFRYYFLCDDAYISFRYARNLALGRGLVFNPGEHVEGYTSFLWTLQLALGEVLHLSSETLAPALGVGYTVGAMVVCVGLVRRNDSPRRGVALFVMLALLACNRTWAVWTTGGLETRSFTFYVLLSIYSVWRALEHPEPAASERWLVATSLSLSAATLSRPDAQIFVPLFVALVLLHPSRTMRRVVATTAPLVVVVGLHYVWRKHYYGYWLPNTYYAKVHSHEHWADLGWRLLWAFVLENAYYLTVPFCALGWARLPTGVRRISGLACACMGAHALAYCHFIGGDVFEFRIFDFYVPLLAWVLGEGVAAALVWRPAVGAAAGIAFVAYSAAIPMSAFARTRDFTPIDTFRADGQFKVTPENTLLAGVLPGISRAIDAERETLALLYPHYIGVRQEVHRAFWRGRVECFRRARGSVELESVREMSTTNGSIGVLGYYVDLPLVDFLGLTDAEVAHSGTRIPGRLMAHDLRPPIGYLNRRHVRALLIGATETPVPQTDVERQLFILMPLVSVPDGTPRVYSLQLANQAWLNFVAWDEQWVHRTFSEAGGTLLLGLRPPEQHGSR